MSAAGMTATMPPPAWPLALGLLLRALTQRLIQLTTNHARGQSRRTRHRGRRLVWAIEPDPLNNGSLVITSGIRVGFGAALGRLSLDYAFTSCAVWGRCTAGASSWRSEGSRRLLFSTRPEPNQPATG
jgi:hypothetical protein